MHRILRSIGCGLLVFAFAGAVEAQDAISRVWRADTRAPAEIFQHGLQGRGSLMDLLEHSLGGSCEETTTALASVYVSTSAVRDEAIGFIEGRLGGMDEEGPHTAMYLYEIRADITYMSVPHIIHQVIRAGNLNVQNYNAAHSRTLERLLLTTSLGSEREVVTHYVDPGNILHATPVYYQNGDLVEGDRIVNAAYQDANTQADLSVENPNVYVPPASIRLDYHDDSSCSQSCDSSASSALAVPGGLHAAEQCAIWNDRLHPALINQIL